MIAISVSMNPVCFKLYLWKKSTEIWYTI